MMDVTLPRPERDAKSAASSSFGFATRGEGTLLGVLPAMRADPIGELRKLLEEPAEIVRMRFGPRTATLFKHPTHIQQILVDHAKNYTKGSRHYEMLRLALGNGLVTSDGSFWLRQRRLAQPAFHRTRIAAFGDVMVHEADAMVDRWQDALTNRTPIEVAHEMSAVTLRIVGRTLLGTKVEETDAVRDAVVTASRYLDERADQILALPAFVPSPANLRFKRAMATLDGIVYRIIAERRGANEDRADLLSMFMAAKDEETGESMSDRQLRDEVMTMFLAGHETTATALTWTFYLLSLHPQIERTLRADIHAALGDRLPTLEDLRRIPLLERVVKESMRLYPPVWIVGRAALEKDEIGGIAIKPDEWVFMTPYLTQRHPEFWPNPEAFDPDRFLPEAVQSRPRFAYFPFAGGPRQCIGDSFALMEAQLVLATVLRRTRLTLAPWQTVALDPLITLRPKFGMAMLGAPA